MPWEHYAALAADYQTAILTGVIPACTWVRSSCERNRRDLERQGTPDFPYRYQPEAGGRVCRMAERLPHIKGPKAYITGQDSQGRSTWNTIQLEPWQCWYLMTMFSWVHVGTGLRRFRVSMLLVPRKNAKSTIAAVIVLYMLTCDGESGAECYSAATTRDQAKVVGEIAWEMARRSPEFCEFFGVRVGSKTTLTLSVPSTASKFAPLSADAHTLDALNVSLAVIDELHAHKTRDVTDVIDTATGARAQPMIVITTTAGVETGGICHEKMSYLHQILEGTAVDETFFGINYTIDRDDDYRDPAVHRKANPNYGISVKPEELTAKVLQAEHTPSAVNNFLCKHLNVWVRSVTAWLPPGAWDRCTVPGLTLEALKDKPCWIGVDMAEVRDIAAIFCLFKLGPEAYAGIGKFYLPKLVADRSPIAQLPGFIQQGHINGTEGDQADFARIQHDLLELCETLKAVQEIDFDRALAAQMQQQIKAALEPKMGRDGADRFVVTVPQRVEEMDPAMKMTERIVMAGTFQHDGNPAMSWMIANVVTERNFKDEIYPRKAGGKDSPNKIDGPVAMFTALSQAMRMPAEPEKQYQIFVVGGKKGN